MLILTEELQKLRSADINRCHELLNNNFIPYNDALMDDDTDEELRWGIVKNRNLLKDDKFGKMYSLDRQNRTALLAEIEKRKSILNGWADEKKESVEKRTHLR